MLRSALLKFVPACGLGLLGLFILGGVAQQAQREERGKSSATGAAEVLGTDLVTLVASVSSGKGNQGFASSVLLPEERAGVVDESHGTVVTTDAGAAGASAAAREAGRCSTVEAGGNDGGVVFMRKYATLRRPVVACEGPRYARCAAWKAPEAGSGDAEEKCDFFRKAVGLDGGDEGEIR